MLADIWNMSFGEKLIGSETSYCLLFTFLVI